VREESEKYSCRGTEREGGERTEPDERNVSAREDYHTPPTISKGALHHRIW
jgi:hypothetical protein